MYTHAAFCKCCDVILGLAIRGGGNSAAFIIYLQSQAAGVVSVEIGFDHVGQQDCGLR
jgi:hypothetical protein